MKNAIGKNWIIVIATIIIGLRSLSLWADEAKVSLIMDKNELTLEDQVELQVVVEGSDDIEGEPVVNNTNGFEIQGQGQSSQVTIINGVTQMKKIFQYILIPQNTGSFNIGPADISIGGKAHSSNQLAVKVEKSQANPRMQKDRPFFIEAQVSNKSPYIGEQIIYTFRLMNRVQITNASLNFPEFKGFWKEELGPQRDFEKIINGVSWHVTEIKLAIFPQEEGKKTIDPVKFAGAALVRDPRMGRSLFYDSFFDMDRRVQQVRLNSGPVELNVRPLPLEGRPQNYSNLVGKFRLKSNLSKTQLKVGESATLTVQIEGEGNIRDAQLPEITWEGFKIYEDKPEMNIRKGERGIFGTKMMKKALVPLRAGDFSLPPIEISYFDPETGTYQSLKSEGIALTVLPTPLGESEKLAMTSPVGSSGTEAEVKTMKKEIKILGEDLTPIMRDENLLLLGDQQLSSTEKALFLGGILFFPFCFLITAGWKRRRDKIFQSQGHWGGGRAYRSFKNNFEKLHGQNLYSDSAQLLRDYLGQKLNFDGRAMTALDVQRKLSPFQVSEQLQKEVENFLKQCEMGQFGGPSMVLKEDELKKFKENLLMLVKNLEKEIKS